MEDIKKYLFVKPFDDGEGVVPVNADLQVVNGIVYLNDCMLTPFYQKFYKKLIDTEEKNGFKYLKPTKIIYNKV